MTLEELMKRIDELALAIAKLDEMLTPDKGGPGSGCNGPNCGRPSGSNNDRKPTDGDKPERPRSGVRPSAVNPNAGQIEYVEEPRTRPRSGISPSRLRSLDEVVDEFMEQYSGLMESLAKIEAAEKVHRHEGESMEDCVARGIRTLMSEGYDQEQATAMAYKMCGEKGACCGDKK